MIRQRFAVSEEILDAVTGEHHHEALAEKKKILSTIISRKGSAPRNVGTKMLVLEDGSEYPDWYHPYDVTKGSRSHYFNYGGGVSVQPVKWFSISFAYTRMAIYGSIVLNLTAFADR